LRDANGHVFTKQDPVARQCELRPGTAAVICADNNYQWNDDKWMDTRQKTQALKQPLSIYEVHLSSWDGPGLPEKHDREFYNYRELAQALSTYIIEMGFTHIELMPITEHPYDQSWGYQTTGYFAPTSRFGTPDDFAYFVDHMHQCNIGVIVDWVPAHFPKDAFALGRFDGTALYEHMDPRLGEHQDWGTYIFNYGRNEVQNFLIANALYWLKEFHVDGLRVAAVSSMLYLDYSRDHDQWVPNEFGGNENLAAIEFIKKLNTLSHDLHPGTMIIAEESTAYPQVSKPIHEGGLGYTMKWNMGWMNDFLDYFGNEPVHRKHHQSKLTFSLVYAFNENFILPLSHDEVVHGKGSLITRMPGDVWQKFANLRSLFATMFAHPGKKLLFMGSEIAQWREWDSDGSLDWPTLSNSQHVGIKTLITDLNKVYKNYPCLWENDHKHESFEWMDYADESQSIISFMRYDSEKNDKLLCICNFTPVPRDNYSVGVPLAGTWEIVLNTDCAKYGGSDYIQENTYNSQPQLHHGQEQAISVTLPPLAVLYLKLK
ncbi:MAG: 1,4-alpha-glucan branching protein GlgB, partial [Lentisphaeraceae bacterium]|nr:1,4-alpha-glucan branching protein GlgB [Lentisphaeraceae bacterium]